MCSVFSILFILLVTCGAESLLLPFTYARLLFYTLAWRGRTDYINTVLLYFSRCFTYLLFDFHLGEYILQSSPSQD
jgi:hypothetical protein